MSDDTTHRQIVYRVLPGSRERAQKLASVAGACRYVWNELLDQQESLYQAARLCGSRPPSPTFFTLGKAFTQLRAVTPWLQELPFAPIRYSLKYQADAWQRYFKGQAGRPRFKRRGNDSVTLPENIRIQDGKLWFPKVGWLTLRRRGGNPYPDGEPIQATVKRVCGKWYAVVCYRVAAVERTDDGTAVGVDMNAGQVATSDGTIHRAPDVRRLEARKRRYQRKLARQRRGSRRREKTRARLARTHRRIAMARRNWQHHVSRHVADAAHTVCIEDLNTKGMTRSAKGTAEAPGQNVRQKAGLNRVVRDTGWHGLRQMLGYKAGRLIAVNPAYTSQTCAECGTVDARSRRTQASFTCVACGHAANADVNAARNILASGTGAAARGGCRVAGPANREMARELAA